MTTIKLLLYYYNIFIIFILIIIFYANWEFLLLLNSYQIINSLLMIWSLQTTIILLIQGIVYKIVFHFTLFSFVYM